MAYCKHIYNLLKVKPGNCVYTESGLLKSQYIIHLSIPLWKGGTEGGKDEHFNLINSYLKALNLAQYLKIKSLSLSDNCGDSPLLPPRIFHQNAMIQAIAIFLDCTPQRDLQRINIVTDGIMNKLNFLY